MKKLLRAIRFDPKVNDPNWNDEEHRAMEAKERSGDVRRRLAARRGTRNGILVLVVIVLVPVIGASYSAFQDHRSYAAHVAPGLDYYNKHDYPNAEREFRSYIADGGTVTDVHYYLGMCLYNEGRSQDALPEFRQDTFLARSWSASGRSRAAVSRIRERSWQMIDRINGSSSY